MSRREEIELWLEASVLFFSTRLFTGYIYLLALHDKRADVSNHKAGRDEV